MIHNFTDEQLQLTILDASDQRSIFIRTARELEDIDSSAIQSLRTLLYHLPDQQQDWEACEFADIRKGDRVKRVKKNSDGTISTIEGPATFHHLTGWGTYDYYLAFREDDSQDNITLYRIPVPVEHPDQQDDWQECTWGDILHTDERVKAEYISGTVIEGIPDGISDNGVYLVDGNLIPYSTDARWYRIPAPVAHPVPEEHPIILVHKFDGDEMPTGTYASIKQNQVHNFVYELVPGDGAYPITTSPTAIDDWTPAKVIADES